MTQQLSGLCSATRSGAHYVFHTASPYITDITDAQKQLLDPALNGTRNVMGAAVKSKYGSIGYTLYPPHRAVCGNVLTSD